MPAAPATAAPTAACSTAAGASLDVEDCIAAARHLAATGRADPERLAIRGGSAGGYTTLCALTFHDCFKAGASWYGIGDLEALLRDTHKFESRYLDRLVGPWPEAAAIYRARSPLHHADGLSCPVIFLQGLDDKVVPPNQAEAMVAALRRQGRAGRLPRLPGRGPRLSRRRGDRAGPAGRVRLLLPGVRHRAGRTAARHSSRRSSST